MKFKKNNIRFIDSLHFLLKPLRDLPKIFNIADCEKGYFPFLFNTLENANYIGTIPSEEMFGAKNMMPDDYEKISYEKDGITIKSRSGFLPWYEVQSGSTWNLKEELVKYCRDDVKVLSKSILAFRKINIEGLDVDPFKISNNSIFMYGYV